MAGKVAAAALQYSKWLSRFICWAWAIYRFLVLIVVAIVPQTADAIAQTIVGMDTIMMANVSTYLVNSLGEKWLYSNRFLLKWLDKKGFQTLINKVTNQIIDTEEEGENNGDQNG